MLTEANAMCRFLCEDRDLYRRRTATALLRIQYFMGETRLLKVLEWHS